MMEWPNEISAEQEAAEQAEWQAEYSFRRYEIRCLHRTEDGGRCKEPIVSIQKQRLEVVWTLDDHEWCVEAPGHVIYKLECDDKHEIWLSENQLPQRVRQIVNGAVAWGSPLEMISSEENGGDA